MIICLFVCFSCHIHIAYTHKDTLCWSVGGFREGLQLSIRERRRSAGWRKTFMWRPAADLCSSSAPLSSSGPLLLFFPPLSTSSLHRDQHHGQLWGPPWAAAHQPPVHPVCRPDVPGGVCRGLWRGETWSSNRQRPGQCQWSSMGSYHSISCCMMILISICASSKNCMCRPKAIWVLFSSTCKIYG